METLRRPAWARVDESVALAARTTLTTASVRTHDSDNDKALVHGRGLSFLPTLGGLVDPQARNSEADSAHECVWSRLGRAGALDEGLDGHPHLGLVEARLADRDVRTDGVFGGLVELVVQELLDMLEDHLAVLGVFVCHGCSRRPMSPRSVA